METDTLTILLVDDEEDYLELLHKRLSRRGMEIHTASTGNAAIELVTGQEVDVVVLDVKMPGLDGIETLSILKEREPLVEVIMLTGHASLEAAERGMELGAFDYLMKPVSLDELLLKIEDAARKKRLAAEETGTGRPDRR